MMSKGSVDVPPLKEPLNRAEPATPELATEEEAAMVGFFSTFIGKDPDDERDYL
jgi:hypothetical protein